MMFGKELSKCPLGRKCPKGCEPPKGCQWWVNLVNYGSGKVVGNCAVSWIPILLIELKETLNRREGNGEGKAQ